MLSIATAHRLFNDRSLRVASGKLSAGFTL